MLPEDETITAQERKSRPNQWLPPCRFLGPLTSSITSLNFRSSLMEHQAIVRFKNQYGMKISENVINEGLYFVAILHFLGPGDDDYDLFDNSPIPEMTCFNSSEVFTISEEVARWEKHL